MEITRGADGRAVCPFDHTSLEFAENYREIVAELQEKAPLAWTEAHGGYWVATSYDVVRRLGKDETYLVIGPNGIGVPRREHGITFVPGEADGAEHQNYRLALNPMFTREVVDGLRPMIEQRAQQTLDALLIREAFDLMHDFLQPLVHGVVCEHLGIELDESSVEFVNAIRAGFAYASGGAFPSPELKERFEAAWATIVATIDARRARPANDVISQLVQWTDPVFSDDEVQRMTLNVILGAADTTTVSTALTFLHIDQHPELRAHFAEHPERIEPSLDEFLRLITPSMHKGRTARSDFEFDGVQVKAGERVLLSHWGANHDPSKFPNPHSLELDRNARQHVAMSFGVHACPGAWLAKAIAAAALRALVPRAPDLHVDVAQAEIDSTKADDLARWRSMPVCVHEIPAHAGRRH